jgi:hypothetical protein
MAEGLVMEAAAAALSQQRGERSPHLSRRDLRGENARNDINESSPLPQCGPVLRCLLLLSRMYARYRLIHSHSPFIVVLAALICCFWLSLASGCILLLSL